MAWSTYLIQTKTGRIGPKVEGEFSWDLSLTDGNISLTLMKSAIPPLDDTTPYLSPWWGGVVLFWDSIPIMAGPIASFPTETEKTIQISCKSIWSILDRRTVVPDMRDWTKLNDIDYKKNWRTDTPLTATVDTKTAIPIQNTEMYDKEYSSLARLAVEYSMHKVGGELPIDTSGVPITKNTDDNLGTPPRFKITDPNRPHYLGISGVDFNKSVASVLNGLTANMGGPDIFFKPMLNTSTFAIYWKMQAGKNEDAPKIENINNDVWDTTAHGSDIVNLSVTASGAKLTNRVLGQDLGNNGNLVINTNTAMIKKGYPILETGISKMDPKRGGTIKEVVDKAIAFDSVPRRSLSGTIRANSDIHPMGTYWPGDVITLVTNGWYTIPNGARKARIEQISGDSSMNITVSFSEEAPLMEEAKWISDTDSIS